MDKTRYGGLDDGEGESPERQPGLPLGWRNSTPDSVRIDGDALIYNEWMVPTAQQVERAGPAKRGNLFQRGDRQRPRIMPVASKNMLFPFLDIARDGSAETIRRYAQQWGPLRIGPCGCLLFHPCVCGRTCDELGDTAPKGICGLRTVQYIREVNDSLHTIQGVCEPLAFWRLYAHLARAIVDVYRALQNDEAGNPDDVALLTLWASDTGKDTTEILAVLDDHRTEKGVFGLELASGWTYDEANSIATEILSREKTSYAEKSLEARKGQRRNCVENAMCRWLEEFGVVLQFEWQPQTSCDPLLFPGRIKLGCTSVLGAIGVLLVQALSGETVPAFCSGCQRFFSPTRARVADKRAFCPACRKRKNNIHQRESRRRKKIREAGEESVRMTV